MNIRKDKARIQQYRSYWVDYVIIGAMACLALFSMGEAINELPTSLFLMALSLVGLVFSYFFSKASNESQWNRYDSFVLVFMTAIAVIFQQQLNHLLPNGPLPMSLWACGFLNWTLALTCFGLWRDQSKLFVVVPSIALFGLIGVYDTYKPAVFLFFIFLLLVALLFGRVHARAMLQLALESGFVMSDSSEDSKIQILDQDVVMHQMRKGAWRWMAGPEWALGSAAIVIMLSVLGAPFIRKSVQSIAGKMRVPVPKVHARQLVEENKLPLTSRTAVGNGPISLSNVIDGYAMMDKARYLMVNIYPRLVGQTWATNGLHIMERMPQAGWYISKRTPLSDRYQKFLNRILDPKKIPFRIAMVSNNATEIPAPEFVTGLDEPSGVIIGQDGQLINEIRTNGHNVVSGFFTVSGILPGDGRYPQTLNAYPSTEAFSTTDRVKEFTLATIAGKKTDWAKALAIELAIDHQCKYNLDAPAVPEGDDPVDYFLFVSHQGYCDLFATAMAQMAKIAGIDSRYAVGYLTSDQDRNSQGDYILRENEMHAWAELKFHGLGWVPFDATTGAVNITPSSSSQAFQLMQIFKKVGLATIVLVGVVLFMVKKPWRRLSDAFKPRHFDAEYEIHRLYDKFSRRLEYLSGTTRLSSMPPKAFLESIQDRIGPARNDAIEINTLFLAMLYGPGEVKKVDLLEIKHRLRMFKRFRKVKTADQAYTTD